MTTGATDGTVGPAENPEDEKKRPNPLSRFEKHVQSRTLAGLFELVPLLATVGVVLFLVRYADGLVRPLPFVADQPWDFPGLGVIVLIIAFYVVGILISLAAGRRAMDGFAAVIGVIPVVKVVYGVMRQATSSIGSQYNFSRVVFIEWPRSDMIALGFVTGRVHSPESNAALVSVYIPTVPNPTSGNMAFVLEDDVIETTLTVDDAMKLVFSGGIVIPDTVNLARLPFEHDPERRMEKMLGQFNSGKSS